MNKRTGFYGVFAALALTGALLTLGGCNSPLVPLKDPEDPKGPAVPAPINQTTTYKVTFIIDGVIVSVQTVVEGKDAVLPPANLTKPGFIFDGWDGKFVNITADTIITAKWKENTQEQGTTPTRPEDPNAVYYTVKFMDGDTVYYEERVKEGDRISYVPENPTKEGFSFLGYDSSAWTTPVTGDVVINMSWKEKVAESQKTYNVYFNSTGTNPEETLTLKQVIAEGGLAVAPATNPTKTGYDFDGWVLNGPDGPPWDPTAPITEPTYIWAKWKEKTIGEPGTGGTDPATPINPGTPGQEADINFTLTPVNLVITGTLDTDTFASIKWKVDSNMMGGEGAWTLPNHFFSGKVTRALQGFSDQSKEIKAGYTAASKAYPTNTKLSGLVTAEGNYDTAMRATRSAENYAALMAEPIDAILDVILGDFGAERSAFDAEFDAYKKGYYYTQKQIDNDTSKNAFISAVSGLAGIPSRQMGKDINGMDNQILNMAEILTALENNLVAKLNAAIIDGSMTNVTNKNIIEQLNRNLIIQIGQDAQEFSAMGKDGTEAGFSAANGYDINWSMNYNWNKITSELTQATGDEKTAIAANFDPAFIKGRDEISIA